MKRTNLVVFAGLMALIALVSGVSATVVNFDDLKGDGSLAAISYAGMSWDEHWSYYDWEQSPYTPHSGAERIYSHNWGGWFGFSNPVDFNGAWFSGDGTSCYFDGYLDGAKVGTSASVATSSTPAFLKADFPSKVNKVNIVCNNYNYFVVDDITYDDNVTPAPEFPSVALPVVMIVGMLGAVMVFRKQE
jgi:hypothetical protein